MGPPDSRRVPRAPRYSGCRYASWRCVYGPLTLCGHTFQNVPLAPVLQPRGPTTPDRPEPDGFGLCPVRSPLPGASLLFSLPPGTKMFQFPGFASPNQAVIRELHSRGLPHSDIRGSKVACTSPRLFAACHVLPRLPEPQASAVRPFLLLAVHRTWMGP